MAISIDKIVLVTKSTYYQSLLMQTVLNNFDFKNYEVLIL